MFLLRFRRLRCDPGRFESPENAGAPEGLRSVPGIRGLVRRFPGARPNPGTPRDLWRATVDSDILTAARGPTDRTMPLSLCFSVCGGHPGPISWAHAASSSTWVAYTR